MLYVCMYICSFVQLEAWKALDHLGNLFAARGKIERDGSRWKLSRIFYGLAPLMLLKINHLPILFLFFYKFSIHSHTTHITNNQVAKSSSVTIKSFYPNRTLPHIIIRKYIDLPADACFHRFIHQFPNLIHSRIHHKVADDHHLTIGVHLIKRHHAWRNF